MKKKMKLNKGIMALCMVLLLASFVCAGGTEVDVVWEGNGRAEVVVGNEDTGTDIEVEWAGSGLADVVVWNSDAETKLHTLGGYIQGTFHAVDHKDNPYNYGIDTFDVEVIASTENGGYIYTRTERLDGLTSMYGGAGQITETYVSSDDTTELAFGSRTNYASMVNAQYGRDKTSSGRQIEATGNYYAYHTLESGYGDSAGVTAIGDGTVQIKMMGESTWQGSANMGHLPVCGDGTAWANNYARYDATGSYGNLYVDGYARNSVSVSGAGIVIPGDGNEGSAQYHLHIQHSNDFSYNDFGLLVQ